MCKENMTIYNASRKCPPEAQKPITAGRLKGKTDINPMWRIKMLTELFGPCGFGWIPKIHRTWIETDEGTGEKIANVHISLRVKHNGEWSEPIEGIGGAMFVENERNGIHVDDDCYKKAYTDAISVACKALGIAADIYWQNDPESKYYTDGAHLNDSPRQNQQEQQIESPAEFVCTVCGKPVGPTLAARTQKAFGACLCKDCGIARSKAQQEHQIPKE